MSKASSVVINTVNCYLLKMVNVKYCCTCKYLLYLVCHEHGTIFFLNSFSYLIYNYLLIIIYIQQQKPTDEKKKKTVLPRGYQEWDRYNDHYFKLFLNTCISTCKQLSSPNQNQSLVLLAIMAH